MAAAGLLCRQAVQDAPPVVAEDVHQDPAQPHSVVIQRLVHTVARAAALGHQLAAIEARLTQLARWHIAGLAQTELADASKRQAVCQIALVSLDLLGMPQRMQIKRARRQNGMSSLHTRFTH